MKQTILALLCAATAVGALAGPSKKGVVDATSHHATPAAADPVAEFKALVAAAAELKEWTMVRQHSKTGKWSKQYYALGQVKFDVKRTDSLISPAMGVVSFPINVRQSEFFDTEQDAAQSTSLSKLRMTFYYNGKYLLNDNTWQVDQFAYYASFGDNPPDPTTVTLPRDKLLRDREAGTGEASLLAKWIR